MRALNLIIAVLSGWTASNVLFTHPDAHRVNISLLTVIVLLFGIKSAIADDKSSS